MKAKKLFGVLLISTILLGITAFSVAEGLNVDVGGNLKKPTVTITTKDKEIPLLASLELETDFIDDLAWVRSRINGKYGIIDTSGNLVVPLIYEGVFCFDFYTRGLTWVMLAETEKWGLIDTAGVDTVGNVVVPYIYDHVGMMDNDKRAWVEIDGKHGLVDATGNVLVPVEYESVFFWHDGIAAVMLGGKWGFIDSDNDVILPFEYDYVSPFSNGLARVVITNDGKAIHPYSYSAPEWVWLKGKFGFVDMSGKVVVPIKYDYAAPFFDEDGFVFVELDGYSGIIDMSGNAVGSFGSIYR